MGHRYLNMFMWGRNMGWVYAGDLIDIEDVFDGGVSNPPSEVLKDGGVSDPPSLVICDNPF